MIKIWYNNGHVEEWKVTGFGGEPFSPLVFEFETGLGDERRTVYVPVMNIVKMELSGWTGGE